MRREFPDNIPSDNILPQSSFTIILLFHIELFQYLLLTYYEYATISLKVIKGKISAIF